MKKVNLFSMLAVTTLMLSFASCNSDEISGNAPVKPNEPTSMQLFISAPKAPATYANPNDANATLDEIEMKTVDVLVYQVTATSIVLEQISRLKIDDFDYVEGSDKYRLKADKKIATTTGEKRIFVAMNCNETNDFLPDREKIVSYPAIGTTISNVINLQASLAKADDLSNSATGFAMFSTKAEEVTLVTESSADYASENAVAVTVKRLVAKISVQEHADLRDENQDILSQGGWLTDLEFGIGNANKSAFLLQNVVEEASAKVVQDPNWASFQDGNFFGVTNYSAVDEADATIENGIHPKYAPENTAKLRDPEGKNLTYVSVRAKYVPAFFSDGDGNSLGNNNSTTQPESFWVVMLYDGTIRYFKEVAVATEYFGKNSDKSPFLSAKYEGGICYFRGYLNKEGQADTTIPGSKAAAYDVLRNIYYKATIKSIKAPGEPIDKDALVENTSITLEIDVQPWVVQTADWDL